MHEGRRSLRSAARSRRHEGVKDSGSFEVRFPDGRREFVYWDDVASRLVRPNMLTSEQALEQARAFAERDKDAR